MNSKVKVVESDGRSYEILDAVAVYVGVNSLSVERADGTLVIIPFSAIKSTTFEKNLFRLGGVDEREDSED